MKTFLSLTVAFFIAGLALADSAQAQVRERVVTVSTISVSGPPVPRQAPFYRPAPPVHVQRHHHSSRQDRQHRQQARMADWYASRAVAQAREGWRLGCARNHPRWSTSYHDHYQWAYNTPRHKVMREIENRDRILSRCWAYR